MSKEPWSDAEDLIIVEYQSEHGNKWAEISKKLPGRSVLTITPLSLSLDHPSIGEASRGQASPSVVVHNSRNLGPLPNILTACSR